MSPSAAELILRRLARKCREIARMPAASVQTASEMRKMAAEIDAWAQGLTVQLEVPVARYRK